MQGIMDQCNKGSFNLCNAEYNVYKCNAEYNGPM